MMTLERQPDRGMSHLPVMPVEVIEALLPAPGKLIVDATLGGAGHTRLLLQAGATVIGVDQDPFALERARALNLPNLEVIDGNFRDLDALLGPDHAVDGVLMDLGVSSFQLDDTARGFSYHSDALLDMRMRQSGPSARDVVNDTDQDELARIIYEYGEERHSRRIARGIVQARERVPIETTRQLAEIIKRAYPGGHARGIHPARRTFQALRIHVNDELGALRDGLEAAVSVLRPGGRLVVISFHSLEDRIIKHFMRDCAELESLHKKPLEPSEAEMNRNLRARSAKLRVARKVMGSIGDGSR
jgi:16S rRNA (cytosine1402-N4)-methyltransferase